MITKKLTLTAPAGLHARPAGELVNLVKSLKDSKVTISTPLKTVNAASMLSILSLGLKCGSGIEVRVEGGDEEAVLNKICSFIENLN